MEQRSGSVCERDECVYPGGVHFTDRDRTEVGRSLQLVLRKHDGRGGEDQWRLEKEPR